MSDRKKKNEAIDAYISGAGDDSPYPKGPDTFDVPTGVNTPPTPGTKVEVYMRRQATAVQKDGKVSTAQQDRYDRIARNIRLLQRAAPTLAKDPAVVAQLAMDPYLAERMRDVGDADRYLRLRSTVTSFEQMPIGHQVEAWNQMTRREKAAYRAQGLQDPLERLRQEQAGLGIGRFGKVPYLSDAAENIWDVTGGGLTTSVGTGLTGAMHGFERAANLVSTTYRAGSALLDQQGANLGGVLANPAQALAAIGADPGHFLDLWGQAYDGEDFYKPGTRQRVEEDLVDATDEQLGLIYRLSKGDSIDEIAQDMGGDIGTPEYAEAWRKLQEFRAAPTVRRALDRLAANKISPGRDLARAIGLEHGDPLYSIVSGAGDAVFQVVADPTLLAGKAAKAVRFQRWAYEAMAARGSIHSELAGMYRRGLAEGVTLTEEVAGQRAMRGLVSDVLDPDYWKHLGQLNLRQHQRMAVAIADHHAAAQAGVEGAIGRLQRAIPNTTILNHTLLEEARAGRKITTVDDFTSWMADEAGVVAMMRGDFANNAVDEVALPRLTRFGTRRIRTKLTAIEWIDKGEEAGLVARINDITPDEWRQFAEDGEDLREGANPLLAPVRATARGVKHLTSLIPTQGFIAFSSPDTPERLAQLLDFGVRGRMRDVLYDRFLLAKNPAAQRAVERDILATVFGRLGILNDPDYKPFVDEWLHGAKQRYGLNDVIELPNGQKAHVALFPRAHRADAIQIPDFLAVHRMVAQQRMASWLTGWTHAEWVDRAMSYWKRGVIWRPAFIPRAGGEEMLSQVARWGPGHALKQWAILPTAAKDPKTPLLVHKQMRAARHWLYRNLDDSELSALINQDVTGPGLLGENIAAGMRKVFGLATDAYEVRAYRQLAYNPHVQKAQAEVMGSGIPADIVDDLVDRSHDVRIPQPEGIEDIVLRPVGSEYADLLRGEDPFIDQSWDWRLQEIAADPLPKTMAKVAALRFSEAQARRIEAGLNIGIGDPFGTASLARQRLANAPGDVRHALLDWLDTGDENAYTEALGLLDEKMQRSYGSRNEAAEIAAVDKIVRDLPKLHHNDRHALLARADDLFRDVDAGPAYAMQGDELLFSGSVVDLGDLDVADISFDALNASGRIRPLSWSGPGLYVTNYGPYATNYARTLRDPGLAANPTVHRFRTTDGKPLKLIDPSRWNDATRSTFLEGVQRMRAAIVDELGLAEDSAGARRLDEIVADVAGDEPWSHDLNPFGVVGKMYTHVLEPAVRGVDGYDASRRYNQLFRESVIDPLKANGWDGVLDHDSFGGVTNMALWSSERLQRVGKVNAVELEARSRNALAETEKRAQLIRAVERGDQEAARQLALRVGAARATSADYIDDLVSSERFGGAASAPARDHVRIYVPMLNGEDAREIVRQVHGTGVGISEGYIGVGTPELATAQAAPIDATKAQLLQRMFDPEWRSFLFEYADQIGSAGLMPGVRWASSDANAAEAFLRLLDSESVPFLGEGRWKLGYVDVPRDQAKQMRMAGFKRADGLGPQPTGDVDRLSWGDALTSQTGGAARELDRAAGGLPLTGRGVPFDPDAHTSYALPEWVVPKVNGFEDHVGAQRVARLAEGDEPILARFTRMGEGLWVGMGGNDMRFPLAPGTVAEQLDQAAAGLRSAVEHYGPDVVDLGIDLTDVARLLATSGEHRARAAQQLGDELLSGNMFEPAAILYSIGHLSDEAAEHLALRLVPVGLFDELGDYVPDLDLGPLHEVVAPSHSEPPALRAAAEAFHGQVWKRATAEQRAAITEWMDDEQLSPWLRDQLTGDAVEPAGAVHLSEGKPFNQVVDEGLVPVWKEVNDLLTDPNGDIIHGVARPLGDGRYRSEHLDGDIGLRPPMVTGPRLVQVKDASLTDRMTAGGFSFLARGVAAMSRKPLVRKLYADNLRAADRVLAPMMRDENLRIAARAYVGDIDKATDALLEMEAAMPPGTGWITDLDDETLLGTLRGRGIPVPEGSDRAASTIKRWWANEGQYQAHVNELALTRSIRQAIPYIDDHKIRSQFAEMIHNVIPFWFAEEQFYKRWIRTGIHSPEGLRRLQLLHHGMKSAGWIDVNDYGEETYTIPGASFVNDALARFFELLPGSSQWTIPMQTAFSGQLKSSAPGFDRVGMPSPGPLFAIPVRALAMVQPEIGGAIERTVYGDSQQSRSLPELVVPAFAMRLYNFATARDEDVAASTIAAIQFLEANHPEFVPGPDASPEEVDTYIERVRNHARIINLTKALVGFFSPATPTPEFDPADLSEEFQSYLRAGVPIEQAVADFLKANPDAEAYQVFSTEIPSKAPARATDEAYQVMVDHEGFFRRYGAAGPWLLPQSKETDPFNRAAWYEMLALKMRVRKGDMEAYRDMKYAEAAPWYFEQQRAKDAMLAAETSSSERQLIREDWRKWRDEYLATHRIFAEDLQSRAGHNKRMAVLDQIEEALADPDRPDVEHADELALMVRSWREFQAMLDESMADRSERASLERKDLRLDFAEWAEAFAERHPTVLAFYQRILEPELDLPPDVEEMEEGVAA